MLKSPALGTRCVLIEKLNDVKYLMDQEGCDLPVRMCTVQLKPFQFVDHFTEATHFTELKFTFEHTNVLANVLNTSERLHLNEFLTTCLSKVKLTSLDIAGELLL